MELHEIKDLLSLVDQSSLREFHLKNGSFELYLNKNSISQQGAIRSPQKDNISNQVNDTTVTEAAVPQTPQTTMNQPVKPAAILEGKEIVSPLVGVVYLKPSPDKPVFKKIGDRVSKGDVLCIIEAMKVMNELTSDVTGEIIEVLVENEQVVEFNQPLFKVKEG